MLLFKKESGQARVSLVAITWRSACAGSAFHGDTSQAAFIRIGELAGVQTPSSQSQLTVGAHGCEGSRSEAQCGLQGIRGRDSVNPSALMLRRRRSPRAGI